MKNKEQIDDIHRKIIKGLEVTRKNLIREKKKNNGTLVYYKDGKIVKVKAKDLPG